MRTLNAIVKSDDSFVLGAMHTTVDRSLLFYAVTDDPALTMRTNRGQSVDRTLE
jgi:hypothetical protein